MWQFNTSAGSRGGSRIFEWRGTGRAPKARVSEAPQITCSLYQFILYCFDLCVALPGSFNRDAHIFLFKLEKLLCVWGHVPPVPPWIRPWVVVCCYSFWTRSQTRWIFYFWFCLIRMDLQSAFLCIYAGEAAWSTPPEMQRNSGVTRYGMRKTPRVPFGQQWFDFPRYTKVAPRAVDSVRYNKLMFKPQVCGWFVLDKIFPVRPTRVHTNRTILLGIH